MNWLDLGLILILIVFIIIGIKKGFMTSMLSNFSFSINLLLSFFIYKPFGFVLDKIFNISGTISNNYMTRFTAISDTFSQNLLSIPQEQLSDFVGGAINESGLGRLGKWYFNVFLNKPSLYSELHESGIESRTIAEIMSNSYATFFSTIIYFVITMILLYGLILLFRLIAQKLRKVGFIRIVDNIFGAFYGVIRCLIILVIFSFIIKLLSPISGMHVVTDYINGSFFGKLIFGQVSDFINNFFSFGDIVRAIFNK